MKTLLTLDFSNFSKEVVGKSGFSNQELESLIPALEKVKKELLQKKSNCTLEFTCFPYGVKNLEYFVDQAKALNSKYHTLVVVGIGGSDLGTRAAYQVLKNPEINTKKSRLPKLEFLGDTTDPTAIEAALTALDLKNTCFNFVSRSGETIEVLSHFHFWKEKLKSDQIVVTTGNKGYLAEVAKDQGYLLFKEPEHTGDRFAVLSVMTLFPLAFANIKVEDLLLGASHLGDYLDSSSVREDPMLIYAALQYLALKERKQGASILWTYSHLLSEFGRWYRQLWAESLGKKGLGLTPLSLLGPADQHSYLQLLNEGAKDKTVTFMKSQSYPTDYLVPAFKDYPQQSFSSILNAEYEATAYTISQNLIPNLTISIPTLNAYYLGQLFYFFEITVSYLGALLEINPYDQPGVEENKKLIAEILRGKKLNNSSGQFKI